MSPFGNIPVQALVDAVEKHVGSLDDDELAALLRGGLATMPSATIAALVQSIFDAFRDRGESSEDAAEGADAPLAAIEEHDPAAVGSLVQYAHANAGLLEDALTRLAESHSDQLAGLPPPLVAGITGSL
jgi:hypothetical protein